MFPTARERLSRPFHRLFFQAALRNAANATAADVNSIFRNAFPTASTEILSCLPAEEKFLSLSDFSQSFSLNGECRCLFPHTISAFPEKNASQQPTILAKYSNISNSPQANFSLRVLKKRTESEYAPADAADAQKKNPCSNFEHGFFNNHHTKGIRRYFTFFEYSSYPGRPFLSISSSSSVLKIITTAIASARSKTSAEGKTHLTAAHQRRTAE